MRTITRVAAVASLALSAVVAGDLAAQQPEAPPQCRNLRFRSNFRLNGAERYIDAAERATYADQKRRQLNDAVRVLTEAATRGDGDQMTMWFLFGRAYLMQGDLVGADSALARASRLTDPECQREIVRLRRNAWVPIQNDGVALMAQQQFDSALVLFRRSNAIYRDDPTGYLNMASVFMSQDRYDSAGVYFRLASKAGRDPRQAELRSTAAFNAARLLERAQRFAAAETVYRDYLAERPNDVQARAGLAGTLQAQGRGDEAAAIYDSILSRPDSVPTLELFNVGVSLFRQQRYAQSAQAFEAGLRRNPHNRDALFNLTNAYLAANDDANELAAAKRLVAVDPNNRHSLRLLASGYLRAATRYRQEAERAQAARDTATFRRLRPVVLAYQDSTVRALAQSDSLLAWEIQVLRFEPGDSTVAIRGGVQNLRAQELPAFVLTLEFYNERREVVATERVELPALNTSGQPGSSYDFNLTVNGRDVVAYRYRSN